MQIRFLISIIKRGSRANGLTFTGQKNAHELKKVEGPVRDDNPTSCYDNIT